jgi:hypothetical protein
MDEQPTIAETDHFIVWVSDENGESTYHVELGGVSLHLTWEEWDEFVTLIKSADQK